MRKPFRKWFEKKGARSTFACFLFIFGLAMGLVVTSGTLNAAEKEKNWQFAGNKSNGAAGTWGTAEDGRTRLDIGCNQRLGRTVSGSLNGYTGGGLTKIDDKELAVIFEVADENGKTLAFNGKMNYFAPDKGWAYRNFPPELLDAFEHGRELTLRNDKGIIVAQFNLKGAAPARAFMRDVCGF